MVDTAQKRNCETDLMWLIFSIIILLKEFISLSGYDAFRDGYLNTVLPGGPGDTRNVSALPFTTDTNRDSDGVTSAGVADATSPNFPLYKGSLANTTDRYKFFVNYLKSAEEQGIGILGDGDAIIEDAKYKIIQYINYQNSPKPSIEFPVYAALKWNPSNFALQRGEYYRVETIGASAQFWNDGGMRVGAEGYDSYYDAISNCYVAMGRCRGHLKKHRRYPKANWMSLLCAVGDFVRPLTVVAPGAEAAARYLPLDESTLQETIFHVGYSFEFRANYTGQLICFANDAHTLYWNNYGQLNVKVTRMSWPPTNDTYYQALYREACDSAIAVYRHRGNWTGDICNPNGGGSGWEMSDVLNTVTRYTSGKPSDYQGDLK
jgi:hypothetical protein